MWRCPSLAALGIGIDNSVISAKRSMPNKPAPEQHFPISLPVNAAIGDTGTKCRIKQPRDARLLRGHEDQGISDLSESLDRIGRGRPRPHRDRDAFALAMLPLAAKFIARGVNDKAASMAAMLGAPPDMAALDGLRAIFSSISGHDKTRILVDRYLQVVEALTRH